MVLLREPPTYDLRRIRGQQRIRRVQELLGRAPAQGPFRILVSDDPLDAAYVAQMFALLREKGFIYDVRRTPSGLHEITIERRQPVATGTPCEEQNGRPAQDALQEEHEQLT